MSSVSQSSKTESLIRTFFLKVTARTIVGVDHTLECCRNVQQTTNNCRSRRTPCHRNNKAVQIKKIKSTKKTKQKRKQKQNKTKQNRIRKKEKHTAKQTITTTTTKTKPFFHTDQEAVIIFSLRLRLCELRIIINDPLFGLAVQASASIRGSFPVCSSEILSGRVIPLT